MSHIKIKHEVVHVVEDDGTRCDGPTCSREEPWQSHYEECAAGWYAVYHQHPTDAHAPETLVHFCGLECLAAWATEQATLERLAAAQPLEVAS